MRKFTVILISFFLSPLTFAQSDELLYGVWRFSPEESSYNLTTAPASGTIPMFLTHEPWEEGSKETVYNGRVYPQAALNEPLVIFYRFDGEQYQWEGRPGASQSYLKHTDNLYEIGQYRNGELFQTTRIIVSPVGNRRQSVTFSADPDVKAVNISTWYKVEDR